MIIPASMYIPPIPKKTSELENDSEFITIHDVPTNLSSFTNDMQYVDQDELLSRINALPLPPDHVSQLVNDSGYITSPELQQLLERLPEPPSTTSEITEGDNLYFTDERVLSVVQGLGYKKTEMFKAVTDPLGIINITFEKEYASVPHVTAQLMSGWSFDKAPVILDLTTKGCRIRVEQRKPVTLLGIEVLLAVTTPVPNVMVSVKVTPH
jgi:hypothetical protein